MHGMPIMHGMPPYAPLGALPPNLHGPSHAYPTGLPQPMAFPSMAPAPWVLHQGQQFSHPGTGAYFPQHYVAPRGRGRGWRRGDWPNRRRDFDNWRRPSGRYVPPRSRNDREWRQKEKLENAENRPEDAEGEAVSFHRSANESDASESEYESQVGAENENLRRKNSEWPLREEIQQRIHLITGLIKVCPV